MRRRLGHVMLSRETGAAVEIAMNRRHVQRDPWPQVEDTLLHEMVRLSAFVRVQLDEVPERFTISLSQVTSRRPQKA